VPSPKVSTKKITASNHFLNVDLDLSSPTDLQPLIDLWGKRVFVLHAHRKGRHYQAHLELVRSFKSADAAIRAWCSLVSSLPAGGRKLWKGLRIRDLNVALQTAAHERGCETVLSARTLQAVSETDVRLVLTVYGADGKVG
jgi:hypothetical protein